MPLLHLAAVIVLTALSQRRLVRRQTSCSSGPRWMRRYSVTMSASGNAGSVLRNRFPLGRSVSGAPPWPHRVYEEGPIFPFGPKPRT